MNKNARITLQIKILIFKLYSIFTMKLLFSNLMALGAGWKNVF